MKNRPDGLEETRYVTDTELMTHCRVKKNAPNLLHIVQSWNSYFHSVKGYTLWFQKENIKFYLLWQHQLRRATFLNNFAIAIHYCNLAPKIKILYKVKIQNFLLILYTAMLSKLYDDPKNIIDTTEEKIVFRLIFTSFFISLRLH